VPEEKPKPVGRASLNDDQLIIECPSALKAAIRDVATKKRMPMAELVRNVLRSDAEIGATFKEIVEAGDAPKKPITKRGV
jgi:hypothetical protein